MIYFSLFSMRKREKEEKKKNNSSQKAPFSHIFPSFDVYPSVIASFAIYLVRDFRNKLIFLLSSLFFSLFLWTLLLFPVIFLISRV